MAGFFAVLSIVILYAEIANVLNLKHNIIYDVFNSTNFDVSSPYYFYVSNVNNPDNTKLI